VALFFVDINPQHGMPFSINQGKNFLIVLGTFHVTSID